MFHMIRDFFLLLLLVAGVEMAIRHVARRWDFGCREPVRVERAAQQLPCSTRSVCRVWRRACRTNRRVSAAPARAGSIAG
ncbi:MAG: hypothetical protein C0505_18260 [Leptothrix sp. (in: Bacteria)]|nr:hypothetical protein [Leptothrix sp. (in: b-proteobacteria)]